METLVRVIRTFTSEKFATATRRCFECWEKCIWIDIGYKRKSWKKNTFLALTVAILFKESNLFPIPPRTLPACSETLQWVRLLQNVFLDSVMCSQAPQWIHIYRTKAAKWMAGWLVINSNVKIVCFCPFNLNCFPCGGGRLPRLWCNPPRVGAGYIVHHRHGNNNSHCKKNYSLASCPVSRMELLC